MIIGEQLATYSHVPQSLASYICATFVCAKTLVSARKRLICTKLYSYSTELSIDQFLDRYSRGDKTYKFHCSKCKSPNPIENEYPGGRVVNTIVQVHGNKETDGRYTPGWSVKGIISILENSAVNNQINIPSKGGNETTNTSDINLTERMNNDELGCHKES
jgi:hypothetical protein